MRLFPSLKKSAPVHRQDQGLDRIEFRHVPEPAQGPVRDWFAGRLAALAVDGSRSVLLPHPAGEGRVLKVKGAGLSGGPVQFGTYNKTGPVFPVFDYEGRMMEDSAIGHDGAWRGGASFQQAANEYRVARRLADLGYAVVPCLGYGCIGKGGLTSWFSVFDHEPGLEGNTKYPELPLQPWLEINTRIGVILFELAVRHDLLGFCWYSATPDSRLLIRDLHPFRFADPFNMSQISWVMQFFFALHIRGNDPRLRGLARKDPALPPDLHVWQYRAFCPAATLADHDDLRRRLVVPYMLKRPEPFFVERLIAVLRGNRITAALMEACPEKFARA